jgi:hypothetical protein
MDILPELDERPRHLVKLMDQLSAFERDGDTDSQAYLRLEAQVCIEVRKAGEYSHFLQRARCREWPTAIKWSDIPARIMALKQNIMNITTDGAARERDPVYLCFLKTLQDASLGRNFVKLAKGSSAPTQVYLNARPG